MTDYLEDAKYTQMPMFGGMKTDDLVRKNEGPIKEKMFLKEAWRELGGDGAPPETTDAIFEVARQTFDYFFAGIIAMLFWMIGLDFWEAKSKIIIFICLILVPTGIAIRHFIKSFFEEDQEVKKPVKSSEDKYHQMD